MHPGLAPSESAPAPTRVTAPEEIIALARLARAAAGGGGPEAVLRTAVELLAVRIPNVRAISAQRSPNFPELIAKTLSPGDSVLTNKASIPPEPVLEIK